MKKLMFFSVSIFILLTILFQFVGVQASIPNPPPGNLATNILPNLAPGETIRVSVASDGTQANEHTRWSDISADGRYVVFSSYASNLVPGDTNNTFDVFVHDLHTGETTRVSVASDGTQGNGASTYPTISADGRFVAFQSGANNLVAGDTNGQNDIFVHDMQTKETTRVSVASDGTQANSRSDYAVISPDGRFVAFSSFASNLVIGDTNGVQDVFVHDRQTKETVRVSVSSDGIQGNDLSFTFQTRSLFSADGRYVAFYSRASNLVIGDSNNQIDVFVHDLQTSETIRVSVSSNGTQGNQQSWIPGISANGRFVAFMSSASNLVEGDTNSRDDAFVHDLQTGETTRVSVASDGTQGNGHSYSPILSSDGRYVGFHSYANNLVAGDTNGRLDVFVHDRQSGDILRVSVASDGTQGHADSLGGSISGDGQYVSFYSTANNLVPGDTNNFDDAFVHRVQWPSAPDAFSTYLPLVIR